MFKVLEPTSVSPHKLSITIKDRYSIEHEAAICQWRWISTMFFLEQSDAQFWWQTTGRALALLLAHADYTAESQSRHLIIFAFLVAPELGPAPDQRLQEPRWKSFMTDDNTPLELSWDWGLKGDCPTIRYSIEPIGSHAGASVDRLNQHAGPHFLRQLSKSIPGIDHVWFEHFAGEFVTYGCLDHRNTESHETRFFAALDLHQNDITVKAYFFPAFKAIETAKTRLTIVDEAFVRLPGYQPSAFGAFNLLKDYMRNPPANGSMEIEMLAIDCISPAKSRLKVYSRSRFTSFNSVRTILTLNGALGNPHLSRGLEELQILWNLLFGANMSPDNDLPHVEHRTAGILYNFEIKPNEPLPVPKIYIPVRHYARNDFEVLEALRTYLQHHHGEHESVEKYMKAIKTIL